MSTDRELLEFAAKAAGFTIAGQSDLPSIECDLWWNAGILCWGGEEDSPWTPLTDDGDTLRLAVMLHMTVEIGDDVCAMSEDYDSRTGNYCAAESMGDDPCAATRRAIVRAENARAQEELEESGYYDYDD